MSHHTDVCFFFMDSLYDTDFYMWTLEQARLLREGRLSVLDIEHLAEEIEDMGKNRERALESQLERLLAHLLKWRYQPEERAKREHSWRASIEDARERIEDLLVKNPGLQPHLAEIFLTAYPRGCRWAVSETNLPNSTFPKECPWTLEQVLAPDFWPD
jgi:hypothetical protein